MSKIFFSGIAGSGVSALAGFMADRGHSVLGSDRSFDRDDKSPIAEVLRAKGITIVPQDGKGINTTCDLVVFSTSVENDHPEIRRARELGIMLKPRPEFLSEIVADFKTLAIAGTSGKSTTAGMTAFLMQRLGLQPNFIGGGRVKQFRDKRNLGNSHVGTSNLLVVEACESDGSIIYYHPSYSVILNLSLDHNAIEKTAEMFETLGKNTKKMILVNSDDPYLSECSFEDAIGFSIDKNSQYQAKDITYNSFGSTFKIQDIPFRLSLPGKHNLYNAVACIALLSQMGIALKDVARFVSEFSGLERRFDIHLNNGKNIVIDDYAHNPHKIASLMETVGNICNRVCYIFQPHGFGPTRLMKKGYIETFKNYLDHDDQLFILPIYYAGGTSIKDVSSEDLCYEIKKAGKSAEVLPERSLLFGRMNEWDNYVVFGARDETLADFAKDIASKLK